MTDAASGASNVLSGISASAASSQVNSSLSSLTNNFQSFLSLLTTQLQDQDPTSPVDPNQFTQQIVQMTGVQQQLLTNNLLTTLVGQGQGGMTGAVSYIGKEVMATSANQNISSGKDGFQRCGAQPAGGPQPVHLERQVDVGRATARWRSLYALDQRHGLLRLARRLSVGDRGSGDVGADGRRHAVPHRQRATRAADLGGRRDQRFELISSNRMRQKARHTGRPGGLQR
jgi:hypothetical protein